MSLIYNDPCGADFADVDLTDEDCDQVNGKVVGFAIVSKTTTAFTATGTGDIKLKASWVAALAASTAAAKALVVGEVVAPEFTPGAPTKADSGKANGIQKLTRSNPSGFKCRVDGKTAAYFKSLKNLTDLSTNYSQGTKIGVIFIYEKGHIQYNAGVKGVPIYNFFVSDPVQGDDMLQSDIMFDLEYGWQDDTTIAKASDFIPLDLF